MDTLLYRYIDRKGSAHAADPRDSRGAGVHFNDNFAIFQICYFCGRFWPKTGPGGPGRCLKSLPEAVASFWPSLSANGATGTRFVAETVVWGLMTGDW